MEGLGPVADKYFEEYKCGCVSPCFPKAELPNYCPTHGDSRRRLFRGDSTVIAFLTRPRHADQMAKAYASLHRAAKAWRKMQTDESVKYWPDNRLARALERLEKLEGKRGK